MKVIGHYSLIIFTSLLLSGCGDDFYGRYLHEIEFPPLTIHDSPIVEQTREMTKKTHTEIVFMPNDTVQFYSSMDGRDYEIPPFYYTRTEDSLYLHRFDKIEPYLIKETEEGYDLISSEYTIHLYRIEEM